MFAFVEQLEPHTPRVSMLTQDNYQEKLSILDASKSLAVTRWKASHVLAWLEIDMNMPMYGRLCADNIKSGKVRVKNIKSGKASFKNYQEVI